MNHIQKLSLFVLRVTLGWVYLYAGLVKIFDPNWTAAGFLGSAKTFPAFYQWFSSPVNIGWVNFLNEWGLALIGAALILGLLVRWAALGGILLSLLYYFPSLDFPLVGIHGFIIDDHIIHALLFVVLAVFGAGQYWGLTKSKKKKRK